MPIPSDLKYTSEHEWVKDPEGPVARVGITDHAAGSLGDVVYLDLPEVGAQVTAGEPCGEVESTKSVSELFAPVSGTVTAVNDQASDAPETVNQDPYGAGWLFEVQPAGQAQGLLDPAAYAALVEAAK
ncbi:MAG: glycine cleavage system protein GcvH [Bifidobacteriaceae bacterium]|jgi:glycine cleavage system H protein|nr:glycine cleavage system protein GcvH [Bifidobacteriaceae bacterium]